MSGWALALCLACLAQANSALAYSGAGGECYSPGSGSIGDLLITGGPKAVEDRLRGDYEKAVQRNRRIFNSTPLPAWAKYRSEQERFSAALRDFRGCSGTTMIDYAIASGDKIKLEYVLRAGVPIDTQYAGYGSVFARCDEVEYIAKKLNWTEGTINRRLLLYGELIIRGSNMNLVRSPKGILSQKWVQTECQIPEVLSYFFENGLDKSILNEEIGTNPSLGETAVVDVVKYSRTTPFKLLDVYFQAGVVMGRKGRHALCAVCGIFDQSDGRCEYAQRRFNLSDAEFVWDLPVKKMTAWQACAELPAFAR